MKKCYFLLKGEKGLHFTDGQKLYFPDRKWAEAKWGLFTDLRVTIDKGNYAFISGNMLEVLPLTEELFFCSVAFSPSCTYSRCCIGEYELIVSKDNEGVYRFYANTKEGVVEVYCIDDYVVSSYKRLETTHYRRNNFNRLLVARLESIDVETQYNQYLEENCKLTDELFMEAAIRYTSSTSTSDEILGFKLYNDYLILVERKCRYYSEIDTSFFVYYLEDKSLLRTYPASKVKDMKLSKSLNFKEVEKFCVEHKVCFGYGTRFSDTLCSTTLSAFGVSATVLAWDGESFCMDFLGDKETVERIEKTHEELVSLAKRLGKNCSSSMIEELRKLNATSWLLRRKGGIL